MKLSIIIPVYNTSKYLEDCLRSCIAQNGLNLGRDYEIVCVNDGSTDSSLSMLENARMWPEFTGGGVFNCKSG